MARLMRRLATIMIPSVLFLAALVVYLWVSSRRSNIVQFHPANFEAMADTQFFYSIGDELKNSNEVNPKAPTLLRGQFDNFLVSPDSMKIAIVTNGVLMVVGRESSAIRKVASVDSIYREPKPIGQTFFRDDDFQWSQDSKSLYFIKDEYYASKGSQLFSTKGELWKFDLQSGESQLVLKPFSAYSYFFGRNDGIYFSVPTDAGDIQLEYFDGRRVTLIERPNASAIRADGLSTAFVESPFFSFSIIDYENMVLPAKGVELVTNQQGGAQVLEIAKKSYLTFTRGDNLKGPYYCSEALRSVFLPGDRYFLFNVFCGNYSGPLLIDTRTGNYQRLPSGTRVYVTPNTGTTTRYRITGAGIVPN
jgi:hypothetical protein